MKKLLCLMIPLMAGCGTLLGDNATTFNHTDITGLRIGANPQNQTPELFVGQYASDFARVPVTMGTKENEQALQGTRTQTADGQEQEVTDSLSVCATFGGDVSAGSKEGKIITDKIFATGAAAQAVCDGLGRPSEEP